MKRTSYLLITLLILLVSNVSAQPGVLDPNDPDVIFNSGNHPPAPSWGAMHKWGHTNRLGWNPYSYGYKSYIFHNMAFRLRFPNSYDPNNAEKYPVFVFLHGLGEWDDIYDNEIQLVHGARTHAQHGNEFDGFLLYPQSASGYLQGYFGDILALMDSLAKYVKADLDRVSLGGLSSGGQATWDFLNEHPQAFAVGTPISAASGVFESYIPNILSIPVWLSNGGKDKAPYPETVNSMLDRYAELGGDARHSFYPNSGHGVWNFFWAEPGYFDYITEAHKAQPVVLFKHNEFCPSETIRAVFILTPGFYAYEWQKDGVTISGATLDSLVATEVGAYRARFKRTATSDWSDWSPRPIEVVEKDATVTPPIQIEGLHSNVLPATDGAVTVPLMVPDTFATYEWRRVIDNQLVSDSNVYVAALGQYKVRVTEPFGCSSSFSDIYTVIDASGANAPDKATDLTAIALSNTEIDIFWNNNPSPIFNESLFEVYRSTTAGAGYQLIAKVPADMVTYSDNDLTPNVTYYYVVRAINNNGAAPLSNEASAKTKSDINPPSAPSNLNVDKATRHTVELSWEAATDDVGVVKYDIYIDGNKAYSTDQVGFTINNLDSFTTYSFYVKALDGAGNNSVPSSQVSAFTAFTGLNYKFYTGQWSVLPDFNALTPLLEGTVDKVDISPRTQNDNFGFLWEGYLRVPTTGTYRFYISSDDGSKLYLNTPYSFGATPLINNDGLHGTHEESADIFLTAGSYPIAATFFERGGGQVMILSWRLIGGFSKREIAPEYFGDNNSGSGTVPDMPGNLNLQSSVFNTVQIAWSDASSDESGFEIFRKKNGEASFQMIQLVDANQTSFNDSTVSGSTLYYYKIQAVNINGNSGFTGEESITTPPLPPVPDIPEHLELTPLSTNSIEVSFTDSSNQQGYEIYRAMNDITSFRLYKILNETDSIIQLFDESLYPNTEYYYKVRAFGIAGYSNFSGVGSATTLNSKPLITEIDDRNIYHSGTSVAPVSATDQDGDMLAFTITNLPAFATFNNLANGSGEIVYTPTPANDGFYTISAIVDDSHGGKDTTEFMLSVNSNQQPSLGRIRDIVIAEGSAGLYDVLATDPNAHSNLRIDILSYPAFVNLRPGGNGQSSIYVAPGFADAGNYIVKVSVSDGVGGIDSASVNVTVIETEPSSEKIYVSILHSGEVPASAPWNNIMGVNTSGLLNGSGAATPVGLQFLTTQWNTFDLGAVTGNNSGVYPDNVIRDYYFYGNFGIPDTIKFNVTGLTPGVKYNFTLFGSSTYSSGSAVYVVDGNAQTLNTYNNNQNTVSFNNVIADASGNIQVSLAKAPGTATGYFNAILIEKLYDDGTAPVSPQNFTGIALPNGAVLLQWDDIAYNEEGFHLLKSDTEEGIYSVLNPSGNNSDDTAYVDNSSTGNQPAWFKILAYNSYGNSDSIGPIQVQVTNREPVLSSLTNAYLKSGNNSDLYIIATDDAGEALNISVSGLPEFATLENTGNGMATIHVIPQHGDEGFYKDIEVKISDPFGGDTTGKFSISISDNEFRTVYLNLGPDDATPEPSPWNNFLSYPFGGSTVNNLVDGENINTGYSFQLMDQLTQESYYGMTDNEHGIYPDNVMRTSIYTNKTTAASFQFNNLDISKKYNVVIFSSLNDGSKDSAAYSSGGQTVYLNGAYNTTRSVQLNGLTPNGAGTIEVTFQKAAATPILHLNAIVLQEYSGSPLISPGDLFTEPLLSTDQVKLTWSDRSYNETGFQIFRSTSPNSGFSQVGNTGSNATSYLDNSASLDQGAVYYYKVRARENSNYSDYTNVARFGLAANVVFLNFNADLEYSEPAPWNNTDDGPSMEGLVIDNLSNSDFQNTGFYMEITKHFNGRGFAGVSTTTGVLPQNVIYTNYWTDAAQVSEIKFANLDQRKKYRIGVFGSVDIGGYYFAEYTINGVTKTLNSHINSTKILYFDNISPDANGEIYISVTPQEGQSYVFTSAFTLEGYDNEPGSGDEVLRTGGDQQQETLGDTESNSIAPSVIDVSPETVSVTAFPNPFTRSLRIQVHGSLQEKARVELYDVHSKLVYSSGQKSLAGGTQSIEIPAAASLPPGVYLLRIYLGDKAPQSIKVVKVR